MNIAEDRRAKNRRTLAQFLKFGIVGGSGFLINVLVAIVMNRLHGGYQNASDVLFLIPGINKAFDFSNLVWIVGFLVANPCNFQLNRTWTFQSSKHASWWKEFWPFFLVGGVAALAGFFLKMFMTRPWSILYLPDPLFNEKSGLTSREYWSQIIAIILTIPINFLINKVWTFRSVRHLPTGSQAPMMAPVCTPALVDEEDDVIAQPKVPTRSTS